MGVENHDRLDKQLHAEEYIGMACGSDGYKVSKGSDGRVTLVPGPDGQPLIEKKYCDFDCPTLKAAHAGGQ